jgi:hypothetical protein
LICGSNGRDARPTSHIAIPSLVALIIALLTMFSRQNGDEENWLDRVMIHCLRHDRRQAGFRPYFSDYVLRSDHEHLIVSAQTFIGLSNLLGPADL